MFLTVVVGIWLKVISFVESANDDLTCPFDAVNQLNNPLYDSYTKKNYFLYKLDEVAMNESFVVLKMSVAANTSDDLINLGIFMLNDTDDGMWEHNFLKTNVRKLIIHASQRNKTCADTVFDFVLRSYFDGQNRHTLNISISCQNREIESYQLKSNSLQRSFVKIEYNSFDIEFSNRCCLNGMNQIGTSNRFARSKYYPPNRQVREACGRVDNFAIYNGDVADIIYHPWMAYLRIDNGYDCGASLIPHKKGSSSYLVTSARCVGYNQDIVAIFGAADLSSKKATQINVKKIAVAESTKRYVHDGIALLKLSRPIKFNNNIYPICVPNKDFKPYNNGADCEMAGWGRISHNKRTSILRDVGFPMLEPEKCFIQTHAEICAGHLPDDGEAGVCHGDSGGPLECPDDNNQWYLKGVLQRILNQKCGTMPAVLSNVPQYYDWIEEAMEKLEMLPNWDPDVINIEFEPLDFEDYGVTQEAANPSDDEDD